MNIDLAVHHALSTWGDHPCILELVPGSEPKYTSAADLLERTASVAASLSAWGIRPGQPVALFLENSSDLPAIFLGLNKIGAVPILLKLEWRSLELDAVFENSRPRAIIAEDSHLAAVEGYARGRTVIARIGGPLRLVQEAGNHPGEWGIPPEIASITYTYRGHGYPLGAMVSQDQYLEGARVLQEGLQASERERMLVVLPFAHIFALVGCMLVPLLTGMTMILSHTLHPRRLLSYIDEHRIDYITLVPEILRLLTRFRASGGELSSLKAFVSGGSVLTSDGYDAAREAFGIELLHGYGLTEFAPASRNIRGEARRGTTGPLCSGVECRIADPDPSGTGEILIRTPDLFRGYYRRPLVSAEAFLGGWFRTGDLGYVDGGHLRFVRERKRTRKINGVLVDLEEVRRAILEFPRIRHAEVSCENGELSADVDIGEAEVVELKNFLATVVSPQKVPRLIKSA